RVQRPGPNRRIAALVVDRELAVHELDVPSGAHRARLVRRGGVDVVDAPPGAVLNRGEGTVDGCGQRALGRRLPRGPRLLTLVAGLIRDQVALRHGFA